MERRSCQENDRGWRSFRGARGGNEGSHRIEQGDWPPRLGREDGLHSQSQMGS
jgi:hypothetical protein